MSIRLRISSSGGESRQVQVESDAAIIGRDPECDVVLDNIFVSRRHVSLRASGDGYELTDLDSRNGVEVEGEPIAGCALITPGRSFTVGPFELTVVGHPPLDQATQTFTIASRGLLPLVVDVSTHEVLVGATPVRPPLSRLEFRLLSLLHEAQGAVRERSELGDAIWGTDQWDLNMLHRLVHRLKEKIEPSPEHPRYIITISGVGYRLHTG